MKVKVIPMNNEEAAEKRTALVIDQIAPIGNCSHVELRGLKSPRDDQMQSVLRRRRAEKIGRKSSVVHCIIT